MIYMNYVDGDWSCHRTQSCGIVTIERTNCKGLNGAVGMEWWCPSPLRRVAVSNNVTLPCRHVLPRSGRHFVLENACVRKGFIHFESNRFVQIRVGSTRSSLKHSHCDHVWAVFRRNCIVCTWKHGSSDNGRRSIHTCEVDRYNHLTLTASARIIGTELIAIKCSHRKCLLHTFDSWNRIPNDGFAGAHKKRCFTNLI